MLNTERVECLRLSFGSLIDFFFIILLFLILWLLDIAFFAPFVVRKKETIMECGQMAWLNFAWSDHLNVCSLSSLELSDGMSGQLSHSSVILNVAIFFTIIIWEFLLNQKTSSHLSIVCIEPSTLVKCEILAEMLTAVQVLKTAELSILDFWMVDKKCHSFVCWHLSESGVQPFAEIASVLTKHIKLLLLLLLVIFIYLLYLFADKINCISYQLSWDI